MMNAAMFSSASQEWTTPRDLFEKLNARFSFTCDVAATAENALFPQFFTREDDGLSQKWTGRCWMNPPYGRNIRAWVEKAFTASTFSGALVVGLLPVRTDTEWWQLYVQRNADIRFIRGRLKFSNAKNSAPFPSAIAIWWGWARNDGWFYA